MAFNGLNRPLTDEPLGGILDRSLNKAAADLVCHPPAAV
jgi:hypothetical protein